MSALKNRSRSLQATVTRMLSAATIHASRRQITPRRTTPLMMFM